MAASHARSGRSPLEQELLPAIRVGSLTNFSPAAEDQHVTSRMIESPAMLVLSCTLQLVRQHLEDSDLDQPLTRDAFINIVASRCPDRLERIDRERLRSIHGATSRHFPTLGSTTVREVLDAFVPQTPASSVTTRAVLRRTLEEVSHDCTVITADAFSDAVLARVPEGSSSGYLDEVEVQARGLFPTDGSVPVATLRATAASLAVRPNMSTFAFFSASEVCGLTRRLALWVPLLLLQIAIFAVTSRFNQQTVFSSGQGAAMPVLDELLPSCPAGFNRTASIASHTAGECWLGKATPLDGLHRRDQVPWMARQIVRQLWTKDLPADDVPRSEHPILGAALVGAVTIRTAPPKHATLSEIPALNDARCGLVECAAMNLADSISETVLPESFACSSVGLRAQPELRFDGQYPDLLATANLTTPVRSPLVVIPANATRVEAERLIATFDPFLCPLGAQSYALFVSWAAVNPSTEVVTWVTYRVSLPASGGVFVRMVSKPASIAADDSRLLWFGGPQLIFAFVVFSSMAYEVRSRLPPSHKAGRLSRFWNYARVFMVPDYALCAVQCILLITSVWYSESSRSIFGKIRWSDHVNFNVPLVDVAVQDSETAGAILSLWMLITLGYMVLFLRDFIGVGRLVELIREAIGDVVTLLVTFGLVIVGFAVGGMLLFGSRVISFTSPRSAFTSLLSICFGGDGFEVVVAQSPVIGTIYFLVLYLFIYFFALNLLIAVLTAPLPDVMERANEHLEIFAAMERQGAHAPLPRIPFTNLRLGISAWSLLLVFWNVGAFAVLLNPFFRSLRRLRALCRDVVIIHDRNGSPRDVIRSAATLLRDLYDAADSVPDGPLAIAVIELNRIDRGDSSPVMASFELMKRIVYVTATGRLGELFAESRLLSVLLQFDTFHTATSELVDRISDRRGEALARARELQAVARDTDGTQRTVIKTTTCVTETALGRGLSRTHGSSARLSRSRNGSNAGWGGDSQNGSFAFPATELPTSPRHTAVAAADRNAHPDADTNKKFILTSRIGRALAQRHPLIAVPRTLLITGLALTMLVMILTDEGGEFRTAWLAQSLRQTLAESPWPTYCDGPDCRMGRPYAANLADVDTLSDLHAYFDEAVIPWLNLPDGDTMFSPVAPTSEAVVWDANVIRNGAVYVRQLRAATRTCGVETRLGSSCLEPDNGFSQSEWRGLKYEHHVCPYGATVFGKLGDYPCAGFNVAATTASVLRNWTRLDPATRFIEVSFDAHSLGAPDTSLRFSIMAEVGTGGGEVVAWTWATPEAPALANATIVGLTVVALDIAWWLAVFGHRMRKAAREKRSLRTHYPPMALVACACLSMAALLTGLFAPEREQYLLLRPVLSSYVVWRLLGEFVVPLLDLCAPRSLRVMQLIRIVVADLPTVLAVFLLAFVTFSLTSHWLFGRTVSEYSHLRLAMGTTLRGMIAEYRFSDLYEKRPNLAVFYSLAFFATNLVVLANIVLTTITAGADKSRKELSAIRFIPDVSHRAGSPPLRGAWLQTFLAWAAKRGREMTTGQDEEYEATPATVTDLGRLPLPQEAILIAGIGCHRLLDIAAYIDLERLPAGTRGAAAAFIAQVARDVYTAGGGHSKHDDDAEIADIRAALMVETLTTAAAAPTTLAMPPPQRRSSVVISDGGSFVESLEEEGGSFVSPPSHVASLRGHRVSWSPLQPPASVGPPNSSIGPPASLRFRAQSTRRIPSHAAAAANNDSGDARPKASWVVVPLLGAVCGAIPHRVFSAQAVTALGLRGFTAAVKALEELLHSRATQLELRHHFDADGYLPAAWQEAAWIDIQTKAVALPVDAEVRTTIATIERLAGEIPPVALAAESHVDVTSMPGLDDVVCLPGATECYTITALDPSAWYADIEDHGPAPRIFRRVPRSMLRVAESDGHHSTTTAAFLNDDLNAYFDGGVDGGESQTSGTPPLLPEHQATADTDVDNDVDWGSL